MSRFGRCFRRFLSDDGTAIFARRSQIGCLPGLLDRHMKLKSHLDLAAALLGLLATPLPAQNPPAPSSVPPNGSRVTAEVLTRKTVADGFAGD